MAHGEGFCQFSDADSQAVTHQIAPQEALPEQQHDNRNLAELVDSRGVVELAQLYRQAEYPGPHRHSPDGKCGWMLATVR